MTPLWGASELGGKRAAKMIAKLLAQERRERGLQSLQRLQSLQSR